ncbi:Tubulin polyglutamylase ttll4 [Thoreauomyces humboldtii]|nr:Tubulin polyglutamylase ttll4 [Thoreauomyces humboldtii]
MRLPRSTDLGGSTQKLKTRRAAPASSQSPTATACSVNLSPPPDRVSWSADHTQSNNECSDHDQDEDAEEEGSKPVSARHRSSSSTSSTFSFDEDDDGSDSEDEDFSFPVRVATGGATSVTTMTTAELVGTPPGTREAMQNLDDVIRNINHALYLEPPNKDGRGSMVGPHERHVPALWTSLFEEGPEVLYFPKMGQKVALLPGSLKLALTWKVSGFTPHVVRAVVSRANFALEGLAVAESEPLSDELRDWTEGQDVGKLPPTTVVRGSRGVGIEVVLGTICVKVVPSADAFCQAFTYLPETYMYPAQKSALTRAFPTHALWIVKPPASARGQGIRVIDKMTQLPKKKKNVVVSRYIAKPYLIGGRKFDIRLYVAVTSFEPLRIYLYKEGIVRFAAERYSTASKNIKNRFVHLTNYSVSRRKSGSVDPIVAAAASAAEPKPDLLDDPRFSTTASKWSFRVLQDYFARQGIDFAPVYAQIRDIVTKTIISGHASNASGVRLFSSSRTSCYELFGFDVLLDARLKPWLMEVNISPSLKSSSDVDFAIKYELVSDLLNLVGVRLEDVRRCRDSQGDEYV